MKNTLYIKFQAFEIVHILAYKFKSYDISHFYLDPIPSR